MYLGKWEIDDFLTFVVNTHDPADGAATDADSVATYRVYEDETATPILTGSMALFDSANTVGFYSERIQLTAANGFEDGKHYSIYITATVDSTEGTISHNFQVDEQLAGIETKIDTIDTNVDSILVDTGTTLPAEHAALATQASVDVIDGIVDSILVDTGTTLPAEHALLATAADLATVDGIVDAILVDTSTTLPGEHAALSSEHASLATQASVDTIDGIVDAILIDTGTTLPAEHAALATQASVDTIDSNVDAIKAVTDLLPDAGALTTIDANIDSILVDTGTTIPATLATLATQASVDTIDGIVDSILVDTGTTLPAEHATLATQASVDTIDANVDSILVDTGTTLPAQIAALNDLASSDVQTVLEDNDLDHLIKVAHPTGDPVADSLIDLIMNKDGSQTFDRSTDSLEGQTDGGGTPPSAAVIADAVWDELIAGHVAGGSFGAKNQNLVPSETIGDYKADVSGLATQASVDVIDGIVDSILVDTGTTLPGEHAALATQASVDTIDGIVDAILVDTSTTLPAEHAALATAADLATVDANIDAILIDTGTTLPAEHALLATSAEIAALNDLSAADIQTILETNDLDHLAKVAHPTGDPVADTLFDLVMNKDGSQTFDRSTDSLEGQTDGGGTPPTAAAIADAVWDEDAADHTTADTFGDKNQNKVPSETINDYKADVSSLASQASVDTIDGIVDAILVDTGTTLPGEHASLATQASVDTIDGIVDAILIDTGTTLPAEHALLATAADLATVDGIVDAIKAVTDLIPDAGAMNDLAAILVDTGTTLPAEHALLATAASIAALNDLSSADVATELATYDGPTRTEATSDKDEIIAEVDANEAKIDIIDTVVDAILVDTGTDLPAEHAALSGEHSSLATAASIAALNDLSSADIQTVLENNDLDHLLKIAHPSGDPVADTVFDLVMNKDVSQTFDRSTDSLEGLADGSGSPPSAAVIADAVWEEAIAGHTTSTTFGGKNQKVVPSEAINDYKADVSALATQASVDTIDANVDSILVDTGTTLPAEHAALATAAALATVDGIVDAILVDTGTTLPAEHATLATAASIAALNDLSSADVQTVIETNDLDHLLKIAHPTGDPVADTVFDLVMNKDGSQTFDRSTDSLEGIADSAGTPPTAAVIADAVWEEAIADHTTVTTFGGKNQKVVPSETINDYKADVSGLATSAALATVDTVVDAIKAVTDLLPDAGALNDLAAILVDTGTTLPAEHALLATAANLAALDAKVDTVDTVVDAIKAVTDLLPDAGALNDLAAILTDTGTTLPAQISALNDLAAADVQTVLEANDLDHLLKVAHPTGDPTADSVFDLVMNKDVSQTFDRSTDSLEGLADGAGSPPSAAVIADAVWDELIAGHVAGGSFGAKNQNLVPSETINDYKADVSALATQASVDTIDANVDSILVDTGTTLPAEHATLATAASIAALNDLSSADIQTVLETNDLDHLLKVAHPTGDPVADTVFDLVMNKDVSQTFDRATDSLEGLADGAGSPPSAAVIADAVWEEAIADHTTVTTFGGKNQKVVPSETINDYKADVSGLASQASIDVIDSNVDAVLVDTGTTLPAEHALLATAADLATVDTVVDAIKAVTDNLPDAGALNDLAAILVDTGTTLPAEHATLATAASIAALNDLAAADIQTVLENNDLDHLAKVAHPTGDPVADTLFDLIMNADGAQTFDRTTDALEVIAAAGGGSTPATIADAVWDEAIAGHVAGGSFGAKNQNLVPSETIGDYKADVSGLATQASVDTIDGIVDAILVDTGTTLPGEHALLATAASIAALNDLSGADVAAQLAIYDGPTRAEATSDKDEIIAEVDLVLVDTADILTDTAAILVDTGDILDDTADILIETGLILAAIGGGPGPGAITWVYNLTSTAGGAPIADADVWVTTDLAGSNVIASGKTDQYGNVTFYLDAGTVYVWSQKTGYDFDNPDTEVIA